MSILPPFSLSDYRRNHPVSKLLQRLKDEPTLIINLVQAAVVLAGTYGVAVTDDQNKAIISAVTAVLYLVLAFGNRQVVAPAQYAEGHPVAPPPVDVPPEG